MTSRRTLVALLRPFKLAAHSHQVTRVSTAPRCNPARDSAVGELHPAKVFSVFPGSLQARRWPEGVASKGVGEQGRTGPFAHLLGAHSKNVRVLVGEGVLHRQAEGDFYRQTLKAKMIPRIACLPCVQVRGMAKGRGNKAAKSKSPVPDRRDENTILKAGESTVIWECSSPMQFTALSSIAFLQIAGWTWMISSNLLGVTTESSFIVSNWWCAFGLALSSAMATMTYWHSAHHLVRLAVKPGMVDELLITTHTMIGGERTKAATRFDVMPNKLALARDSSVARHKHLMIRGHGNLILDSSGTILDSVAMNRILRGEALMPTLLKAK